MNDVVNEQQHAHNDLVAEHFYPLHYHLADHFDQIGDRNDHL
jgi:hypothetical protein